MKRWDAILVDMEHALPAHHEQLAYYRAVANEYEDHEIDVPGGDELLSAIDAFRPTGDVLELACGPGMWTEKLLRSASSITAVDGAPEMLERARLRLGSSPAVQFVEADLFTWRPERRFDAVFFGFGSHTLPKAASNSFGTSWQQRSSLRGKSSSSTTATAPRPNS